MSSPTTSAPPAAATSATSQPTTRVSFERDIFGFAGGFLFLGVFLGLVFMMAAVLIIYYKQVSEGYEDQRRFDIMRKVGLSRREARRSIRSQILTVFFLPLIVAAVHIAFDFKLVLQLLTLFAAAQHHAHRAVHARHAGRVLRHLRRRVPANREGLLQDCRHPAPQEARS